MWAEALKDGRFKFVERYKDPYSEKDRKKSTILTSDSPQAYNKARKILDKKIKEAINEKKKEKILFHEALDRWYEGHQKSLRTGSQTVYDAAIKAAKEMIEEDVWISNIDTVLLQTAFNKLNYSDEYLSTIKTIFNSVFEYARRMGYIDASPLSDVVITKNAKTREDYQKIENKYLERDEAERLIKEMYRRPSTYRLARLAEFMFLTGMRIGEATAMQPQDFNFEQQQASVNGSIDRYKG
ncbi:MAG: tyrosine recombinase XerC, partial [Enterococcus hulanensis]